MKSFKEFLSEDKQLEEATIDIDVVDADEALETMKKMGIKAKKGKGAGGDTVDITFRTAADKKKILAWADKYYFSSPGDKEDWKEFFPDLFK